MCRSSISCWYGVLLIALPHLLWKKSSSRTSYSLILSSRKGHYQREDSNIPATLESWMEVYIELSIATGFLSNYREYWILHQMFHPTPIWAQDSKLWTKSRQNLLIGIEKLNKLRILHQIFVPIQICSQESKFRSYNSKIDLIWKI